MFPAVKENSAILIITISKNYSTIKQHGTEYYVVEYNGKITTILLYFYQCKTQYLHLFCI